MKNPFDFDQIDDTLATARSWALNHRSWIVDVLRIYVGIALLVRGIWFLTDVGAFVANLGGQTFAFSAAFLAHIIAGIHIAGGILLTLGLWTRVAALVQIPILFGAVFFVHLGEGLFTPTQGLELAGIVLVNLIVIAVYGPGVLSLDHALFGESESQATSSGRATRSDKDQVTAWQA